MASNKGVILEQWVKERDLIPLSPSRPCYDSDWQMDPDDFRKKHPGHIHMHSTMTKLASIRESAGFGKRIETAKWLTLFNLPLASLACKDGADPDKDIGNHPEQNLIRSICVYYGQNPKSLDRNEQKRCPSPAQLSFIRQFALNLAVSDPCKKTFDDRAAS
jgi:hypothetical protein